MDFFDSIEHLLVHLAYEARVYGLVQYKWMYPFEGEIGRFKRTVKNNLQMEKFRGPINSMNPP